jgi:tetratricopeptide (TPR) repeat protein
VAGQTPSTRRTLIILGGMTAAAVVLFAALRWAGYGDALPRELTDEEVSEDEREAAVRRLVETTPPSERPKLIRRVARLPHGEGLAHEVLRATIDADPATADPVLDAYRTHYPDEQTGYVWLLKLRIRQGRTEAAVAAFHEQTAAVKDDAEARWVALWPFLEAMTQAGLPVRAYVESDPRDRAYAFRVLGAFLEDRRDLPRTATDAFRDLIVAHRADAGETAWTAYYSGVALQQDGKYDEAEKAYADAHRRLVAAGLGPTRLQRAGLMANWEDRTWDKARRGRVECLYRLDRWEQGYAECDPPAATFEQLAQRFEGEKRWAPLEKLVERHRARLPNDPRSDLWAAVAHFGRGEYEAAIPLADAYLAREPHRERQDHRAFDVKFRSQVRLGRVEDARRTHAAEARFFPRLHAALILALLDGDNWTAEMLMAGLGERPGGPSAWREFYADPDAGPLLRSERWAGLRAKYPPP